jgi:sarcosine oxidase / L-pipecolate oxidase
MWASRGEPQLFHQTGVVMLCHGQMQPGDFEYESCQFLLRRDQRLERLDSGSIARRFPAWNSEVYQDGFFHARGGYAESGPVIEALVRQAEKNGVQFYRANTVSRLIEKHGEVEGVVDQSGRIFSADHVVMETGAWASGTLPALTHSIVPNGQPVFHLKPSSPNLFAAESFPVFTADIANTGYYGFPLHQDGIVKSACHGAGVRTDPLGDRRVTAEDHDNLRAFLDQSFPSLAQDEIVYTRLCLYADTADGHFWIDNDPNRPGLTVATGGSGHGFKFAPVLGPIIADVVEQKENVWAHRFQWRPELKQGYGREAARRK